MKQCTVTRRQAVGFIGAAGTLSLLTPSFGQMNRPLRLILPVAAGSGVDALARALGPSLSTSLGQPVVIDNQPGAGGLIGTGSMIKSAPDGNTLSIVSNNHVVYPSVLKSVPFDPINDITPIAVIGFAPMVLVVNPKLPVKDAKQMIALMKSKADSINYASGGNGTLPHLAAAMFVDEANVKAHHIPYKGAGPMLTDLVGGQVDFGMLALGAVQPHLKSGALRAIGVASKERSSAAPEIPTFVEQGLTNFVVEAWFAFIGPKGIPSSEVARIHTALMQSFAANDVKAAMSMQGNTIALTSPEQAQSFFRSELTKYASLVKKAGIEPQ
jgi:tripartite-type tricarboxylate transporter receptor subunit TctC